MNEHMKILWTGGWDSTFQLLHLLLIERKPVTPYYLIDAERPSTGKELQTMKRIKERILKEHPDARKLIHPGRLYAVEDIAPDPDITAAFQAIREKQHLGIQYDWLARFCRQHDIVDLQMGIQAGGHIHRLLKKIISKDENGFRVSPEHKNTDEYVLFHRFKFPIFDRTKLQMADFAKTQGWENIMNMTWFCFTPKKNGTPCGKCNPCRYVIEQGMGWRIPKENLHPLTIRQKIIRRLRRSIRIAH